MASYILITETAVALHKVQNAFLKQETAFTLSCVYTTQVLLSIKHTTHTHMAWLNLLVFDWESKNMDKNNIIHQHSLVRYMAVESFNSISPLLVFASTIYHNLAYDSTNGNWKTKLPPTTLKITIHHFINCSFFVQSTSLKC